MFGFFTAKPFLACSACLSTGAQCLSGHTPPLSCRIFHPSVPQQLSEDFSPIFMWVHQFMCKEKQKLNPIFQCLVCGCPLSVLPVSPFFPTPSASPASPEEGRDCTAEKRQKGFALNQKNKYIKIPFKICNSTSPCLFCLVHRGPQWEFYITDVFFLY